MDPVLGIDQAPASRRPYPSQALGAAFGVLASLAGIMAQMLLRPANGH